MRDSKLDRLFLRFRDKGDVAALSQVFDATSRELLELAAHVTRDPAQAEDLLQATFLIAIERARQYDSSRRLMPWLVGILTHEAQVWNRRSLRRVEIDRLEQPVQSEPSVELEALELSSAVIEAIEKLPVLYRDVLVRHLRDGESAGEIGHELERSPGTVRVQIHRGLELLKKSLPAGLVAGGIAALAPRGLAAVRAVIVKQATLATTGVASVALTTVAGGIVVKKIVIVAAVLLLAIAAWFARSVVPMPAANSPVANEVPMPVSNPKPSPDTRESLAADSSADSRASITPSAVSTSAPAAPSARGSLRIVAMWEEDGTPAAEVHMEVALESEPWVSRRRIETVTGSDGVALVVDLEAGACLIDVDRADCDGRVEIKNGEETRFECRIPVGIDVEGIVVDGRKEPVAGAGIWLSSLHSYPGGQIATHSGPDGQFRLRAVNRGIMLGARSAHHAPSDIMLLSDPTVAGRKVQVVLDLPNAGQRLSGLVRDPRGLLLARARVSVGATVGNRRNEQGGVEMKPRVLPDGSIRVQSQPLQTLTNADGGFEIEGVEVGDVPVVVWSQGATPWSGTVHIDSASPARLDVRLPESAVLTGTIKRSDNAPAAKVYVEGTGATMLLVASTQTDEQGAYRLEGLPIGAVRVSANRQRFGDAGRASTTLEVVPGALLNWDALLPDNSSITGRLLDENGAPLVSWPGKAHHATDWMKDVFSMTDADGRFTFSVSEDVLYSIDFHAPGAETDAMPSAWMADVRPGPVEIVLRVSAKTKASCHLRGRLVDSEGHSVVSARLQIYFATLDRRTQVSMEDPNGRFDLGPLPPGTYTLNVTAQGFSAYREVGRWELSPGQTLDAGDLVLRIPGHLHAHVSLHDGHAASEVHANLEPLSKNGAESSLQVHEDGQLESGPLDPGPYALIVHAKGGAATHRTLEIRSGEDTTFDLQLAAGVERTLRLLLPDSDPVTRFVGFSVRNEANECVVREFIDNLERDKSIERVIAFASGRYTIEATGEGHLYARNSFDVPAALPLSVIELRLEKHE